MFRCALCLNVFNVCLHVFFSDFVNSRSRPVDRIKVSFMVEVRTRAASRYRSWSKKVFFDSEVRRRPQEGPLKKWPIKSREGVQETRSVEEVPE
ncbi:hypothetical protein GCK32_009885 [Trichostrongylus colubriformis]|uniref:Secreted protein n=1 Tax=Trichostrongylus colubriformis TaxID=6319 RepID=A0AAN8F034_TRICO